jgi:hypothetical protein
MVRSVLTLAALFALVAGCLAAPSGPAPPKTDPVVGYLRTVAAPVGHDPAKMVQWWDRFVTTYDLRPFGSPKNMDAAKAIRAELEAAGYKADIVTMPGPPPGIMVRGLKMGVASPSHRLALISHYDTVPNTKQGAYDDGSGVANQMEICRMLAKVPTNKTIECLFFDGEEAGALGSGAYTKEYAAGGKDWTWDEGFGYDMTGLNWPGYSAWKLWTFIGTQNQPLQHLTQPNHDFLTKLLYTFLGERLNVTDAGVGLVDTNERSSDELNFQRVGVPAIRFAGGRKAGDYPQYHKADDTTDFVYKFACGCDDLAKGRKAVELGFSMVAQVSYYTILAYDHYDPRALPS